MDSKQTAADMLNALAKLDGLPAQLQAVQYTVFAFLDAHPAYALHLGSTLLEVIDRAIKGPPKQDDTPRIIV